MTFGTIDGQSSLDRYASEGERTVAKRLVKTALKRGYSLSVHDGCECTVKRTDCATDVLKALCTTGEDTLRMHMRGPHGAPRGEGTFLLVWGNAEDGSELVADYTDNEHCNALYKELGLG